MAKTGSWVGLMKFMVAKAPNRAILDDAVELNKIEENFNANVSMIRRELLLGG